MHYYFAEIKSLKIFKSVSLQTTVYVHAVKRLKSIAKEEKKIPSRIFGKIISLKINESKMTCYGN